MNGRKSLVRDQRGLALTEFAFSLPILLTLGLVGLEAANYTMAHLKVSAIASITADNAARVRDSIDEVDVSDLMTGARLAGEQLQFESNGRLILSSLERSQDGTRQWIRWQRCIGDLDVQSTHGRPLDDSGAVITDGTEITEPNGTEYVPSTNPSSDAQSELTGVTVGDQEITAGGGTAVLIAEAVYQYQPLMADALMAGTEIRYISAFNVRQRNDNALNNGGDIAPLACGN